MTGTPYVAAFRMADGWIHRQRFRSQFTETTDVLIDVHVRYGIEPCEISEAWTGKIIYPPERSKK